MAQLKSSQLNTYPCPHIWSDGSCLKSDSITDSQLKEFVSSLPCRSLTRVVQDYYSVPRIFVLCTHAQRSLSIPNAGGHSALSEALSIHYFHKRFGVHKFYLEMEIEYVFYGSSMCDYLADFGTHRVGVSVTRAMHFIHPDRFTDRDADRLVFKKLHGLIVARNAISKRNHFEKSILHIFCQSHDIALKVHKAYIILLSQIKMDDPIHEVFIILTVCELASIY